MIKNKIKLLFITIITSSLLLVGCSKGSDISLVSLDLIDIPMISNNNIKNIINDSNLDDGVYMIETDSNQYIYFNGVDNSYSNISCNLVDTTLEIHADSNNIPSNTQKTLYIISSVNEDIFNKIDLIINNESVCFKNIYKI